MIRLVPHSKLYLFSALLNYHFHLLYRCLILIDPCVSISLLCPKAKRAWPLGPHLVSREEAVTTILPWWQLKEGPKRSSRHGNDKKLDHLRPWQKLRWRLRERLGGQEESTSAQCPTLLCKEPYSARKKLCSEEKLCSTGELCCGGWCPQVLQMNGRWVRRVRKATSGEL